VVIEALMKAMNVNMEKPHDNNGNTSSAVQRDSRLNGTTSNSSSVQQHDRLGPDQAGRSSSGTALAQQPYARGTLAPYSQQQQNSVQQPNIMVPADVANNSTYAVEPGSEYFGDFAFDGMDDILFGFNAPESIFQDFM
jgi:hypothetical protein